MRLRKRQAEPVVSILDRPRHHDDDSDPAVGAHLKDWSDGSEELARKRILREAVEAAFADLPVDYRLVVVLRDIQGLSAQETAKVMKLSKAAVKSRLHRGRLFLRARLDLAVAQ
jgi:RNA polymerase sigma-70 factor (ECF subfamily)